jgi:hypothetical protein
MKKKFIKYSIEEPCHEDWNQMKPDAKGRFCGACSKTVVDFSSMSDFAIVNYLEGKKNEPVCGRFKPDQMDKFYTLPKADHSFSFDLKTVALGLALSTFSAVHADAQVTPIDTSQVIYREPMDGMVSSIEYYDHSDEKFVSGTIVVPGNHFELITVQLINDESQEISKMTLSKEGKFIMPLYWSKKPVSIVIGGPGFITEQRYFSHEESIKDMKIKLHEEILLKGNVISR